VIAVRELSDADLGRLQEIDVSERITKVYRLADGALAPETHDWTRPRWDEDAWRRQLTQWRADLKPDVWLGAFAGGRLVGEASLRYRLSEGIAQLTTLHVDAEWRRKGVARALVGEVAEMARRSGAASLYVSATPSESAVGFYLSDGFEPAETPDPAMFALEPEDIHMLRNLGPPGP
jgi:GNAT superfamily N-acetyltransferase